MCKKLKEKEDGKVKEVLGIEDEEEEDWLAPPPKLNTKASKTQLVEDSTLKELRYWKVHGSLLDFSIHFSG